MEKTDGKIIYGRLRVESTGLEFIYPSPQPDKDSHIESSYILYKYEYPHIQAVVRYHDKLSNVNKLQRQKELKRTYHPSLLRRLKRKIQNIFKTLRDSVVEVTNLLIARAKKVTPAGGVLTTQDKYVTQMKKELISSVGTGFEPLLERYIGHKVVLEMIKGDAIIEYCGVLKEYTADFIQLMDVDYKPQEDQPANTADLIVPRKLGIIRHLGE